mmetsp:Transcript_27556/g.56700  ORF Transcript_27556/g.56700 Transcript_27556/m.56700 type:complete len:119 (+) Transcript_27556:188-544(+)
MLSRKTLSAGILIIALVAVAFAKTTAFSIVKYISSSSCPSASRLFESFDDEEPPKKKGFFANFFEELDAFVDDATSRRLGNGAQYYGKRKSSFYGKNDANRKKDKNVADAAGKNDTGF